MDETGRIFRFILHPSSFLTYGPVAWLDTMALDDLMKSYA